MTAAPQPMIITKDQGIKSRVKYLLTEEARSNLNNLGESPVMVVSVAGVYRTGKSYLMSKLIHSAANSSRREYFPLGSTVQSKTKGIWMWIGPHPRLADAKLVLLDTEGLDDAESFDENHDNVIFVLAVILSDVFVYNSMRVIDDTSLAKLFFIIELTKRLKSKGDQGENCCSFTPEFIWALRDFQLEREINGKEVSDNDYLEWHLKERPVQEGIRCMDQAKTANDVRASLRAFFRERNCFLFPYPTLDRHKLSRLEEVNEEDLEPDFVAKGKLFQDHVLGRRKTRTVGGGRPMTGRMFAALVQGIVDSLNDGNVIPQVGNVFDAVVERENKIAQEQAMEAYDKVWGKWGEDFPPGYLGIVSTHLEAKRQAESTYKSKALPARGNRQGWADELSKKCLERYGRWKERVRGVSIAATREALDILFEPIEAKLSEAHYFCDNGHEMFTSDLRSVQEAVKGDHRLGLERESTAEEFLAERAAMGELVAQITDKFSEAYLEAAKASLSIQAARTRYAATMEQLRLASEAVSEELEAMRGAIQETAARLASEQLRQLRQHRQMLREDLERQKRAIRAALDAQLRILRDTVAQLKDADIAKEKRLREAIRQRNECSPH